MARSNITTEGLAVVWSIFILVILEIGFIVYFLIKDLRKTISSIYMLKDENFINFMISIIIGLCFKLLVIAAYYKHELSQRRGCTTFIVEYIPQIFFILAIVVMMLKMFVLQFVVEDSKITYKKYHRRRVLRA